MGSDGAGTGIVAADGRRAALFDLDGVIVDSREPVARSLNDALEAHGRPALPFEELHPWIGAPIHDIIRRLFGSDSSEEDVDAGVASFREAYTSRFLTDTPVQPGMADMLDEVAGHLRLVVATSKPQPHAHQLLEALGLARTFDSIVGPALEARSEPKRTTLERALAELGPADRRVMVGDTRWDIQAAKHLGVPIFAVTWGIGRREELADADAIFDTPESLRRRLLEL